MKKRRSKKFDDTSIARSDGVRYRVTIRATQGTSYGPLDTFSIKFPWGVTVEDKDVSSLMKKAKQEVEKNGGVKQEKVIGVSVGRWTDSDFDGEHHASLDIKWRVLFRGVKIGGDPVFFNEQGKRDYSIRFDQFIPWSEAAEACLKNSIEQLEAGRKAISDLVNSDNLQAALEVGLLTALPQHATLETP